MLAIKVNMFQLRFIITINHVANMAFEQRYDIRMKYWITVLTSAFIIASSITENTNKEHGHFKSYRYITNWDQYSLPKPVHIGVLKNILNKISMYKRNTYCPFGENQCEQVAFNEVILKIINDSVKEFETEKATRADARIQDTSKTLNNDEEEGEEEEKERRHLNFTISNKEHDSKNLLDAVVLSRVVNNKRLGEVKQTIEKLYSSYYPNFKVNKKHRQGIIKKIPFEPFLVTHDKK